MRLGKSLSHIFLRYCGGLFLLWVFFAPCYGLGTENPDPYSTCLPHLLGFEITPLPKTNIKKLPSQTLPQDFIRLDVSGLEALLEDSFGPIHLVAQGGESRVYEISKDRVAIIPVYPHLESSQSSYENSLNIWEQIKKNPQDAKHIIPIVAKHSVQPDRKSVV